ncbi:DUF4440 domain-containing protein [Massilia sp. TS11]|uniref:YybH family protein n=1 Tax=Massilia sp. TS11 TaxID=2908003 RepID=UPI001EDB1197|nr:nuclear transport factor 2 family protein [Massilia sp. TS11]MCG2584594.1 nuclear transport factor 2 family protein [Massilia sp. TS11]
MKRTVMSLLLAGATLAAQAAPSKAELTQQVADTERAFAATMAKRDFEGFKRFLSDEAVFFSGGQPLRGKDAVAAAWKKMYEEKEAPFSWEPKEVEVLDSGTLGFSSGPVYSPTGRIQSKFSSIWRLESDGKWRIIFDHGWPVPDCPAK